MKRLRHARWLSAALMACGLILAACGGGESTTVAADTDAAANTADDSGPPSPEDAAEQNISNLQTADDARDIEVLAVSDGSVSTLRDAVDGDRPVLLWFYAPH
ncbi:MAG: hypothetical protein ACR2P0_05395 [Acidimicrobiales bacterium]